jgi:uncharacterized glyoxalase superfamily protein PhnB
VVPHLSYEDPFAALAWLCRVFGFTEARRFDRGEDNLTARLRGPNGGAVMISGRDDDFKVWMRERAPHFEEATGRSWPFLTHTVSVVVGDVDAHFARAQHEGAAVLTKPKDQPWESAAMPSSIRRDTSGSSSHHSTASFHGVQRSVRDASVR